MKVVQLNYAFDQTLTDPDALLARYRTLTGWSDAVAGAGADRVTVVQRFHRGARIARNGIEYTFCSPSRVHHTVADAQPDVVHVNGLHFAAQTWALRQMLDRSAAIVVQDHGGGVPAGRRVRFDRAIRRRMSGAVDGFLFVAAEQSEAWRRAGLLPSNCRVYEVMEASTTLRPISRVDARADSGIEGEPAVLCVGRLNANKDPLTVVDGFERSLCDLPAATLTMIYDGDELLSSVRARVERSAPLRDRVRLLGRVAHERLPAFYSAADLFVLGSHQEGSGYALLEACACGALPVVTDIPSFRVITGGGSFGALWSAGDTESCARALVAAARSNSAHARTLMAAHFDRALSWPAIGRQGLAAYRDALTLRRTRLGRAE
jgi:glycosyltransferase involved in cell wall biosynthesis